MFIIMGEANYHISTGKIIMSKVIDSAKKIGYEFPIVEYNTEQIINTIGTDEDDKDILMSIIENLETNVADVIKSKQTASIPYIGCLRINPIKQEVINNKVNFRTARKNMTKEQYKSHIGSFINDLKIRQQEKDKREYYLSLIRRNNKTKYENLFKLLGKGYAEMFIFAISCFNEVPFDIEWEEQYQRLSNGSISN